jgi:8-oxo-dGTP diphosphatase
MVKEYTAEENRAWRASQPQKMIVSKVVIKSNEGDVLLLKSNYKNTWQLPGGGVDDKESPELAAVREVKEETGLVISASELTIKGTIYKADEEMLFIIYEYKETLAEDIHIQVADNESTAYQFTKPVDALALMSGYYTDFWTQNYS